MLWNELPTSSVRGASVYARAPRPLKKHTDTTPGGRHICDFPTPRYLWGRKWHWSFAEGSWSPASTSNSSAGSGGRLFPSLPLEEDDAEKPCFVSSGWSSPVTHCLSAAADLETCVRLYLTVCMRCGVYVVFLGESSTMFFLKCVILFLRV